MTYNKKFEEISGTVKQYNQMFENLKTDIENVLLFKLFNLNKEKKRGLSTSKRKE